MTKFRPAEKAIVVGDCEYRWRSFTLAEYRWVQATTGIAMKDFEGEVLNLDANAVTALICLLRRRDGDKVRFEDVDDDMFDLDIKFYDRAGREVEVKTDDDGELVDATGERTDTPTFVFADSGEVVPDPPEREKTSTPN